MSRQLDSWIRDTIAPNLRDRGFRGGPRSFWCRSEPIVCVIQVQASTGNVFGRIRFTINYGARHEEVARLLGDDYQHPRSFSGSQIGRRVGAGRADLWWDIGLGTDRDDKTAEAVRHALETEVLPFLDSVGTPSGFETYWREQPRDYGQMFVDVLARLARGENNDDRTARRIRLRRLLEDARTRVWLDSDATAAAWVVTCRSCGLPALRRGAPPREPVVAMLLAAGASIMFTDEVCEECRSETVATSPR